MIQRIQSLWLVLAIVCLGLCFIFPAAEYSAIDNATGQTIHARLDLIAHNSEAMPDQIMNLEDNIEFGQNVSGFKTWPILTLAIVAIVIATVCLFMYKHRVRQARMVMVGFMINLAYAFLLFFWAVDNYGTAIKNYMHLNEIDVITWSVGAYLPLASLVFLFLAQRAIKKDEAMVRAADRLR